MRWLMDATRAAAMSLCIEMVLEGMFFSVKDGGQKI
jgi:hypothetical protein